MSDSFTPSTIFVSFKEGVTPQLADKIFEDFRVSGFKVSNVLRKYAVEVPYDEENKYINLFAKNDFVTRVSTNFMKGHKRIGRRFFNKMNDRNEKPYNKSLLGGI